MSYELGFAVFYVFNYVCVSAFEQGHLDPWRSKSALIIIIIIIPTKSNKAVWGAFSNGFICRHGVCRVFLTDHGAEFTALAFERYLSQIGIEHRMSTPAYPQSNGKIERFNRTFKQMIQKAVNNQPSRWEEVLNDVLLAYRASISTTTGYTQHLLTTSRHLRMPMQTHFQ